KATNAPPSVRVCLVNRFMCFPLSWYLRGGARRLTRVSPAAAASGSARAVPGTTALRESMSRCVGSAAAARLELRLSERLEEQPCELRSLAGFLVLEVDVDVGATGGVGTDDTGPAPQILGRIALVTQPEVAIACRDLDRSRELLAVGDAQGQVVRPQAREH